MENDFGAAVIRRRIELGLTVRDLAKRLGCSTQRVYALESNENSPTLDTMARVAAALETDVAALIGGDA